MGNFLDNMIKAREEWLKKPNPIPARARYLNAQAKLKAEAEAEAEAKSETEIISSQDPKSELETE